MPTKRVRKPLTPEQIIKRREANRRYAARVQGLTGGAQLRHKEARLRWREANREREYAKAREYKRNNPERIRALQAKYRAKLQSLKPEDNKRTLGEELNAALGKNTLYATANAAISKTLPSYIRDDVVSEIVIAVLEGKITEAEIASKAKSFVSAYFKQSEWHSTVSIYAVIPGTENLTIGDTLVYAEAT